MGLTRVWPELLRRHGGRVDQRKRILEMRMGPGEQRWQARRRKLRGSDSEGVERQHLTAAIQLQFFVIDEDPGQMNDGRMKDEIAPDVELLRFSQ